MKLLHLKIGEFMYFTDNRLGKDAYRILLLDVDAAAQQLDLGIFDCRRVPDPVMKIRHLAFGTRLFLFSKQVTLNALKAHDRGINFSVSASALYTIENDFKRDKASVHIDAPAYRGGQ